MTAKIYDFGQSPARDDEPFGFLEAQVRFLLLLWDLVLDGVVPVLDTGALTTLAWMSGVSPMPRDKATLMLSLQEVWHAALGQPHAAGYEPWKSAVQVGDTLEAQRALRGLLSAHGEGSRALERRLGVVLPMRLH